MNFKDISGQRFGKLIAIKISETRNRGILSWDCICDCGTSKVVTGQELRRGSTSSCGCEQHKGTPKDIAGQKKDKLTAVSSTGKVCANGDYKWNFICDCGNTRIMSIGNFNSKENLACSACSRKRISEARTTHGFNKNHKTYKAWTKMKERCFNPNSNSYADYGARGITVHPYFLEDFMNFYNEIGEAPNNGRLWSIDRIDYTKNYEPGNIRWATNAQQARNKGMMKNNSSGFNGIHWEDKVHPDGLKSTTYAVVQWKEYEVGKQVGHKKSFSVKKFGLLEAFALACEYRENKIKELNLLGYGYSSNHGKS